MKFSEKWLREWMNISLTRDELMTQLTMAGLEVEKVTPVAGLFENVVVAEITHIAPHPDADRLQVCSANISEKEPLTIVTAATNVRMGLKVPLALSGAVLADGHKIKKSKLRGIESHGMFCSAEDLGLVETSEGLLELPADASVGEDLRKFLALDDYSIDLNVTPNRGDCLSVLGVAREVAAMNRSELIFPEMKNISPAHEITFPIEIKSPADCPHYVGRVIRHINPQAITPVWMQERLRRSGLRSITPVVDVTNYVLLELGQPLHAFDLSKLSGKLQVRHAAAGESIILLDGQQIDLTTDTLVIADAQKVQAIAGIMGGIDSAVSNTTRDIFLESAFFNPLTISGRARRYGLSTDSSHRFERGVDPTLQVKASERATELLLSIVGGGR